MDVEDIHTEFLALEDDYDLFDHRVRGVAVWERIRFEVYREILYDTVWEQAHTRTGSSLADLGRRLWLGLRNVVYRNPFLASEHEFLFWGHERRKRQDDGRWWDVYCDPLYDELDLDYLHVETPHLDGHRTPAQTDTLRYLDLISVSSGLFRRLVRRAETIFPGVPMVGLPDDEERLFCEVGHEIEERFNVEVPVADILDRVLVERWASKPFYDRLLQRVNPTVVVLVTSYGKETFIESCKDRGIPVVELQHGIINDTAVAYDFPGDRGKETFPDYLFTFGEFWNDRAAFPIPDERVVPVGYPHLERSRERYATAEMESSETVLFLSQGIVGTELSQIAVSVAEDPAIDVEVVYKVHPGEHDRWRSKYPWLLDSDVEVVDENGRELYRLFVEASAQVGVSSTALYEGLAFDLSTYLVGLSSSEFLIDLVAEGHAELVESAEELAEALEEPSEQLFDTEQFFRTGSVARIGRELDRVANERE